MNGGDPRRPLSVFRMPQAPVVTVGSVEIPLADPARSCGVWSIPYNRTGGGR